MTNEIEHINFIENSQHNIVYMDANGEEHEDVRLIKLFPLTSPDMWIAVFNKDGKELLSIEDPKLLKEDTYKFLMSVLSKRHFVPKIEQIHSIKRQKIGHEWSVTTDRGRTTFNVEMDESIHSLGSDRYVIFDTRNMRYSIPDIAALDRDSRRKLEHYF